MDIESLVITEDIVYRFAMILDGFNDSQLQHMTEIIMEDPVQGRDVTYRRNIHPVTDVVWVPVHAFKLHHRFRPLIIPLSSLKRSKGTEMVNSTPLP